MSRHVAIVLLAAAVPLLAACGSSSSPGSTNAIASKQQAAIAFAACMRTHGVPNFPDAGSNRNGGFQIQASRRVGSGVSMRVNGVPVSAPAFQSAMQQCRSKLPNGGHPPPLSASQRTAMLAFSQCMRTHGVPNFPDPSFGSGGGVQLQLPSTINARSPAFQTAQQRCGGPLFGPKQAVASGP